MIPAALQTIALVLFAAAEPAPPVTAIVHVNVFDGTKLLRNRTVVLRGAKIERVDTLKPPPGALVIDGRTRTLVPGLIDSFVTEDAGRDAAERASLFGVTSFLDGVAYDHILYNDGFAWGLRFPQTSFETLHAAVEAAKKKQRLALVEVGSVRESMEALKADADGLVRIFSSARPPAVELQFEKLAAKKGVFVVPALGLLENAAGLTPAPQPDPLLTAEERTKLAAPVPGKPHVEGALAALRLFRKWKVPIVAGDGLGEPGTAPGWTLLHELDLLVRAGYTPSEALASATSVPAKMFRLEGRGVIAPGARADLVLVTGDPSKKISAMREILAVWKNGDRAR